MRYFLFLGFLILCTSVFAQGLTITNGLKDKSFKDNSIYAINISKCKPENGKLTSRKKMVGKIIFIGRDSISMHLKSFNSYLRTDDYHLSKEINAIDNINYGSFAINDIINLQNYPSYKGYRWKNTLSVVGGMLMFTGVITAANVFVVPEKKSKNALLISGLVQFGIGATLAIGSNNKTYNFKCDDDFWEIKH